MKNQILVFLVVISVQQQWILTYDGLKTKTITSDGFFRNTGTNVSAQLITCPNNGLNNIVLDDNYLGVQKSLYPLPHYEIKALLDVYLGGSLNYEYGEVYLDATKIFTMTYNYNSNMTQYDDSCGFNYPYYLNPFSLSYTMTHTSNVLTIRMKTDVDSDYDNESFFFRNVQIFMKYCYKTCKSCTSFAINSCTSCYQGTTTSGQCSLCTNTNLQYLDYYLGCIQECSRSFIADGDRICQSSEAINTATDYFTATTFPLLTVWPLVPDIKYTYSVTAPRLITCLGSSVSGFYEYNEGISQTMTFDASTIQVRMRATLYLLGDWVNYSSIQTYVGTESVSQINIDSSITQRGVNVIYTSPDSSFQFFKLVIIRIEQVITITSPTVTFSILGFLSNQVAYRSWAIRQFNIDEIYCQANCQTCLNWKDCSTCKAGFKLYKNTCIATCPATSYISGSNCIGYDQETIYSTFFIAAFYDTTTTDDEIPSIFTLVSSTGTNFVKSGVYYSYIPDKRVFGGPLTWLNAKFGKTYTISEPHYAVRLRMTVIFGDNTTGQFKYTINGGAVVTLTKASATLISTANVAGFTGAEYFIQVDQLITSPSTSLALTVECVITGITISKAFCAIADFFIINLKCPTFCLACTSFTNASCTSWSSTANQIAGTSSCQLGYYINGTSCSACSVIQGCQYCSSSAVCTTCLTNFNLIRGQCVCKGHYYLIPSPISCTICNSKCFECYGNATTQCISCYASQKRILRNDSCLCDDYYYSTGADNCASCFPQCKVCHGNLQTDCDEWDCHRSCSTCSGPTSTDCLTCDPVRQRSKLVKSCPCLDGYYDDGTSRVCQNCVETITDSYLECYNLCGDGIKQWNEQCDDANYQPFDGCYLCQYQCQQECTLCLFGNCLQCTAGWELISATKLCSPICGNSIVSGIEQCDDGNYIAQDGCSNCQFSCQLECSNCQYGVCKSCITGWMLNSQSRCESFCGDMIIADQEQCDDGNQIAFDGCYNCLYSCQTECKLCALGICQQCDETNGWYLNSQNNYCETNCGDQKIVGNEQCDDNNNITNDGCFNCLYQCDNNCSVCTLGQCYNCNAGFALFGQVCQPVCGDGIVLGYEDCDDGNSQQFDGCFQCKYQCQEECTTCTLGQCYQCIYGWNLNQITNLCETTCHDLIVAGIEECEDTNYLPYDGCNECKFECQQACSVCIQGQCQSCKTGWQLVDHQCFSICGDGLIVGNEVCDDMNAFAYDGCHQCSFQCQEECTNCINGVCYQCNPDIGWHLEQWKCVSKCGDGILQGLEICDDGNNIEFDGCYNCQYQCKPECLDCRVGVCYQCVNGYELDLQSNCQTVCGDKIVIAGHEQCDDGNVVPQDGCYQCQYQCQQECTQCVFGNCQECLIGWELIATTQQCSPICGNSIVSGAEQCDDGNYWELDGCTNCQFSCQLQCDSCELGVCKSCITGWMLNSQSRCESFCGDMIIADQEQCDDGNQIAFDGCYNCLYSCQTECKLCALGICQQCDETNGWYLNSQNNYCETNCGDQKIVGNEQCDDNNNITNDGCFNCLYQCDNNCSVCTLGQCYNCNAGFALFGQVCQPVCGDGIVLGYEDCDDGNTQQFDGCFQCKYQCQEECTTCTLGQCYQCIYGWNLNQITNLCETTCHDLIVAGIEECEDTNYLPYDGCNECKFECQQACSVCIQGQCQLCKTGWQLVDHQCFSICGDGLIVGNEVCDDMNAFAYDGCHQCSFQCQEECTNCINGVCYQCNPDIGWHLESVAQQCMSICGDGIIAGLEICDDGNNVEYDGCFNCQYQCKPECVDCRFGLCYQCDNGYELDLNRRCQAVCGDLITTIGEEQCDDGNIVPFDGCFECQYSCAEYCTSCVAGVCQDCGVAGWYLMETSKSKSCETFCGDRVVAGIEQCDDGNLTPYDGCFNCNYQCQLECIDCQQTTCNACLFGWSLINGICEVICGDLMVGGWEECDDGNNYQDDGCHNCLFSCQSVCVTCYAGACFLCSAGWQWDDYRCYSVCGDGLVVGYEECDDANDIQYDGCYECEFECSKECTRCIEGICYECATVGWTLENDYCIPVCGDGILIVGHEYCDDGNDIQYDGCFMCDYQCQLECINCVSGQCQECNPQGWTINNHWCVPVCGDGIVVGGEVCDDFENERCLNCQYQCDLEYCVSCELGYCQQCQDGFIVINGYCVNACGDGIVSQVERCDDGNNVNMDGCSQDCYVEDDWFCVNDGISLCFYEKSPQMALTKQVSNLNEQIVIVTFTEMLRCVQPGNAELTALLLGNSGEEYNIVVYWNNVCDGWITFKIYVEFFVGVENPVLEARLNTNLMNVNNQTVSNPVQQLKLQPYRKLTNTQAKVVEDAKVAVQIQLYLALALIVYSVMMGNLDILWNVLDIIQKLSYIKYINVQFPLNLETYFEIFNQISLQPLLELLSVDQIIPDGNDYFIDSSGKLSIDEINAVFMPNFYSFAFCLLIGYMGYFTSVLLTRWLRHINLYHLRYLPLSCKFIVISIRRMLDKSRKGFHFSGLIRILMCNTYDFAFAILLQLNHTNYSNGYYLVNCLLAYGSLLLLIIIMGKLATFMSVNRLTFKNQHLQNYLLEGVRATNSKQWSMQYQNVQMLNKVVFIGLLLSIQSEPVLQAILMSLNEFLLVGFVLLTNPLKNNVYSMQLIVMQLLFTWSILSFIVYEMDSLNIDPMILGWIHIIIFISILGISVIVDTYVTMHNLYRYIRNMQMTKHEQEEMHQSQQMMVLYL